METNGVTTTTASAAASSSAAPRGAGALGGDDFFQLLIAQLTNQDPLQPTTNQELLQQISSIREIELSSSLTRSLKSLTDQQRFGSASSLIGQFVTGRTAEGQPPASGTVVGVRFGPDGRAILSLDSGAELPLEQLETVVSPRETNLISGATSLETLTSRKPTSAAIRATSCS